MDNEQETAQTDHSPAVGNIPIAQIIASHSELVRSLQPIRLFDATSLYAGLLTVPELQVRCSRLESLVHLTVRFADGDRHLSGEMANTAFVELGEGICGAMEDPVEDAFSTLVTSSKGNHRIVEGVWESAAFFLQRTLNITEQLPVEGGWEQLSESVFALLMLSDAVCERSGLGRTTFGLGTPWDRLPLDQLGDLRSRVVFTPENIDALGIRMEAIEPFVFRPELSTLIPSVSLQHSPLLDYPLLRFDDQIVLVLPTAVSIAIRRFVFGGLINAGLQSEAVGALADEYQRLFKHRAPLGVGHEPPIFFRGEGACDIAEYACEIEPGRFIQFIFVLDTLQGFEKDGFVGHTPYEPTEDFISEKITAFCEHAEQLGTVKEGVTVIISCGIGRASFGLAPQLSPEVSGNWDTVFLSAPDAETLTLLEVTPQTVLRICRAERSLTQLGVNIFNLNGFPNLLAWARSLGDHLVDHGGIPEQAQSGPLRLILPTDMVLDLRKERAEKVDRHMAALPDGHLVQIHRLGDSIFEDDKSRPLYVDEHRDDEYGFRLVYRSERLDCWCEVQPASSYERWKMLHTWLPRIGEALSTSDCVEPSASLLFRIHFSIDAPTEEASEVPQPDEIAESISVDVDHDERTVTVHVGEAFELGLGLSENVSESMLVRRMVEGALSLLSGRADPEAAQNLHQVIVPNTDSRALHRFHARRYRDFVRDSILDSPVKVDSIDEATNRLGLGWRFRSKELGPDIDGKGNCSAFLNDVVRGVEDDLCSDLRAFNRRELAMHALGNHEAAMVMQQRLRNTARANLGLHRDKAAATRTILSEEFENNASLLASRVLVELAICECPEKGGVVPGKSDLSQLMSKLLLAIQYGKWSDAIYFDAMEPSLKVTPLGDIHANITFLTDVVEPFGRIAGDAILSGSVESYSQNFHEPDLVSAVEEKLDPRFLAAWEAETGLSIDNCRRFVDLLEDDGIAKQRAVFPMTWLEIRNVLETQLPSWEAIVSAFLIRPRRSWRDVPENASEKDLWPWRFRRQFSLIRRPLVQLGVEPDSDLIVAPGLVRDSLVHAMTGYIEGSFPHWQLASKQMRSWFGTAADERGHAFTVHVAERVRQLGLEAQSEVRVRTILAGRENDRFGDIDVLCWDAEAGRVLLLECKDLHFHKTVGEIAEQIQSYRGDGTGKDRDEMRKHIDRTNAIRADQPALQRYLKCQRKLTIESWIVFRRPVPILLSWADGKSGVRVTTFDQFKSILSG